MDWEAVTAIGQVLGALGVIASLIYLAAQVRQNNRASSVAAKLASTQLLSRFVDSLIADPQLMDVWIRGRENFEALDRDDHMRFSNMCLKAFWFFSAAHYQLRVKTLQEDDWTEFYSVICFWLDGKGVRTWWDKTGRTRFGKSFASFIDAEIARRRSAGQADEAAAREGAQAGAPAAATATTPAAAAGRR